MTSIKNNRFFVAALVCCLVTFSSCKMWNSMFGPKYGCPSNGKNVGAERLLNDEKVPKAKKMKV